ncbi:MAG TPA: CpsD/CapB family tyrosine-protein kinase [Phycisphaerae bacterium]|nr:CpsD/CapB family tyrosine-protein kinase [Phycisphaerae bacterium]HRW52023.1 CpsD/CapB family tyrosine-protein kinase [Phycisphaerae bacterium]
MSNQSNDPQRPYDDDFSTPSSDEKVWPPADDSVSNSGDDAELGWLEEAADLERSMDALKEMTSEAIEQAKPVELDMSIEWEGSKAGPVAKKAGANASDESFGPVARTTTTSVVDETTSNTTAAATNVNAKWGVSNDAPSTQTSSSTRRWSGANARFRKSAEGELAQLWTNVFFSGELEPPKTVVVAAARQGDGATQIAASLAMLGAESNPELNICVVDVNLRRPGLAQTLGVDAGPGVTDVLAGRARLDDALQTIELNNGTKLTILAAGPTADHPLSFIKSRQLKSLIGQLRDRFDHTIFDIASADRHPDAQAVGKQTDGVLVVVNAGSTPRETVGEARKRLDLAGARCLGLVLNQRTDPIPAMLYNVT